jgi:6-pyruvoyltetrahydropterin/6-carboxytetrahydropterin synthase
MTLHLTRGYAFSAAHRLHNAQLSEEENARLYGKCANPHGHGHNYRVEVTLSGPVDEETGMVVQPSELDAFVERQVLDSFDHKNLNVDVPAFRGAVPTTENLCTEIYRRLRAFPAARLERVRIEETGSNSFEYAGE